MSNNPPSTDPYKGVRDFYPEDLFIQRYLFSLMRGSAEQFGYLEYDASVLEPAELYEAKSSQEIVADQTYSFTDRGGRRVTLRPEMTPTLARLVAKKRKELAFPIRWFSIPNVFRYERPQRGRLREHYQLNCDLFGLTGSEAEAEIVELAASVLLNGGADLTDFQILVSSKTVSAELFTAFGLAEKDQAPLTRLLDKRDKLEPERFTSQLEAFLGERTEEFLGVIDSPEAVKKRLDPDSPGLKAVEALLAELADRGLNNALFEPTLMRGFDYYTGMIFEIQDRHPDNNRAVAGGGRYDELLSEFGTEPVPAVGFGLGDVRFQEFLEIRDLLPEYAPPTEVVICRLEAGSRQGANRLARDLRQKGLKVRVDLTGRKVGDQIKTADRQKVPYIICVGPQEINSDHFTIKHLPDGTEFSAERSKLARAIRDHQSGKQAGQ